MLVFTVTDSRGKSKNTLHLFERQFLLGGENTDMKELFLSFSLEQNARQLFQYSEKKDYGIVYAMKIVSIVVIIYGHRRIYSLGYPTFNPETAERVSLF